MAYALAVACEASAAAFLKAWLNDKLIPQGYVCTVQPTDKQPAKLLRQIFTERRHALHLSQRQAARLAGTVQPLLSECETGRILPRLSLVLPLAEGLELGLDEVLASWLFAAVSHPFDVKVYDL